jgi:hypothetical protein
MTADLHVMLQVPLPERLKLSGLPSGEGYWWHVFGVRTHQLVAVVTALHELYQRPRPQYINVLMPVQPPQQAAVPGSTTPPSIAGNGPQGAAAAPTQPQQQPAPTPSGQANFLSPEVSAGLGIPLQSKFVCDVHLALLWLHVHYAWRFHNAG